MAIPMPTPVKAPGLREGVAYRKQDLERYITAGGLQSAMIDGRQKHTSPEEDGKEFYIMSDVSRAYDDANEVIAKANEAFNATLQRFRSTIKNDMASISSSADRVTKEVAKMSQAYSNAINTMNSPEMERAIQNAERLASALSTISQIQSANISFTLLDQKS